VASAAEPRISGHFEKEETMRGVISGIFAWGQHPLYSEGTLWEWGAGLVVILIVAFAWHTILGEVKGREL